MSEFSEFIRVYQMFIRVYLSLSDVYQSLSEFIRVYQMFIRVYQSLSDVTYSYVLLVLFIFTIVGVKKNCFLCI